MSARSTDDRDLVAPADWTLWPKAWPYVRAEWRLYLLALICAPASALLTIAQPWLLKNAIDAHVLTHDLPGLRNVALAFLGAVVAAFVLEAVYTLAISYGALGSITRLRRAVYAHTMGQSQAFFDVRPTGRLLTRVTSDVEALGEVLTAGAMTIALDVMLVLGILVAMAALEPKLTLVLILCAPPVAFVLDRIRRALRKLFGEVRDSLAELNAFTSERLHGVEVVQLYSDEERALRQFGTRMDRYRDATIRTNFWDSLMFAIVDGIASVTVALLLWYGSGDLLSGALTAGTLFAFVDYTGKLFRPIQEFSAKVAILQRAGASLEKIFGLLDHDGAIRPGTRRIERATGHLVLEDVAFGYGEKGILHGVSLEVRPGEVVALVGRTGSGKSTIARLLTRTYDGYAGSIRLDGAEIADLDPHDVRRAIGMVRQDVQLFPGDVRFNLALGADIDDADLEEAIRLCHADVAVAKLGGLGGRVAHGGANLSVGEAQLLSFARTMAHDPAVVVLDEATASVDTLTEARIQAATEAVLARKTVVVIAHRLSTIVSADRIVLLGEGRVLETGSHHELLARGGRYAELFRQQFLEHAATGEAS